MQPDIDEDNLKPYAIDRLPELDAAPVGEHLLVCEERRERLAGWDAISGSPNAEGTRRTMWHSRWAARRLDADRG
jgi:anti-sigma factor RsiW